MIKIAELIQLENGETFFPFEEKQAIVKFSEDVLVKKESYNLISISSYSALAGLIKNVAGDHHAKIDEREGRIYIHNPNNLYIDKTFTYTKNIIIYFEGLLTVDYTSIPCLCFKII
jgi:hypothetical protein